MNLIRCTAIAANENQFAKQLGIAQGTLAKIESNLLSAEKYSDKIKEILYYWKAKRVTELMKEIDFINNL
jgi:DNA-binding XRE family transcriptional regulator